MKFIFLAWMLLSSSFILANDTITQPKRIFLDFEYSLSSFSWKDFDLNETQFSKKLVSSWMKKISEANSIEVLDLKKTSSEITDEDIKLKLYVKLRKLSYEREQFYFSYKVDYTFLNNKGDLIDRGQEFEGSYSLHTKKEELAEKVGKFIYAQSSNSISHMSYVLSRPMRKKQHTLLSVRYNNFQEVQDFVKKLNENFAMAKVKKISDSSAILEIEGQKQQVELVVNSMKRKGSPVEFVQSRGLASDTSL